MKPRIPITDPRFRYVPAAQTDLKKRFEEMKREKPANVTPLPKVRSK